MTKADDEVNEQYNEKVINLAGWIDTEFLNDVLNASLQDEVKVIDHNVTAAVGAGDNYLSILYKTAVTYTSSGSEERRKKFLMIKGLPSSKMMREMVAEMGVFNKEGVMYGKTLPAMERYLQQYFPDSPHFAPESYKCTRPDTLVMEDIGEAGYKMAQKKDQLDLDHCLVTLRTLARFHAISVKLQRDDPELIKSVSGDFYVESTRDKMEPYFDATFPVLISTVEKGGETRFTDDLKEIAKCIYDKLMHMVRPSDGFNVLNHGDLWVNNMMFKYNEDGSVAHTKLVDYQLNRYTTPANDLQYFFFTSPKPEVLTAHMDEMLAVYHQALMADLATLNLDVEYPFEQLQDDMLDRSAFGLVALAQILPVILAPPSEIIDMDTFESVDDMKFGPDDHPMMKNYMTTHFRRAATSYLSHMQATGYLEAARVRTQHIVSTAKDKEKTDDEANAQYNSKVLTSGAWIEAEFLQDVLKNSLQEEVKVVDHKVTAAVGMGDNYLSILYKTAVTFTTEASGEERQKFLMIKGEPTAKVLLDMIEEMGIFIKETAMYGKVLPAMQRYLNQSFPAESQHIAPESYKCTRPNTLVMEDIGESGYKMANRRDQLDLDHCLATLRTVARFHALSVQLAKDDPELIKSVSSDFYVEEQREKMEKYLDATFPVLISAVEKWGDEHGFAGDLREIGKCIWDKLTFIVKATDGFNVLNHGDLWVNNMLFKYNEDGSVAHTKLVDYQLNRYTTPANDLLYFFFTSPRPEVLTAHMHEMMSVYHQALTADLATLNLSVDYSFEQLQEDMLDRATFGVLAIAQILPIIMAPPSEVFDMDKIDISAMEFKLDPEDHPMLKNYMNAHFRRVATAFLDHMRSTGYLEAAKVRSQGIVQAAEARKAAEEKPQAE